VTVTVGRVSGHGMTFTVNGNGLHLDSQGTRLLITWPCWAGTWVGTDATGSERTSCTIAEPSMTISTAWEICGPHRLQLGRIIFFNNAYDR